MHLVWMSTKVRKGITRAHLENAMEVLNQGADAYVTKPAQRAKHLMLISAKLEEQYQVEKMTENKVTYWIKTRARKLEDNE